MKEKVCVQISKAVAEHIKATAETGTRNPLEETFKGLPVYVKDNCPGITIFKEGKLEYEKAFEGDKAIVLDPDALKFNKTEKKPKREFKERKPGNRSYSKDKKDKKPFKKKSVNKQQKEQVDNAFNTYLQRQGHATRLEEERKNPMGVIKDLDTRYPDEVFLVDDSMEVKTCKGKWTDGELGDILIQSKHKLAWFNWHDGIYKERSFKTKEEAEAFISTNVVVGAK